MMRISSESLTDSGRKDGNSQDDSIRFADQISSTNAVSYSRIMNCILSY